MKSSAKINTSVRGMKDNQMCLNISIVRKGLFSKAVDIVLIEECPNEFQ